MKLIHKGSIGSGCSAKIYLDWNEGGSSVEYPSGDEPYHIIKIGCGYAQWSDVHEGILHEMVELYMTNMELAYQRWYRCGSDEGDIWFRMSHAEYSECISRASWSILTFIGTAEEEFIKYNTEKLAKLEKLEKPKAD